MKTILRWIALVPGCLAAMLVVNTINGFTLGRISDVVDQIGMSWFGSLAFVLAAYWIAPRGKSITAIVIGTTYASFGILAVIMDIRSAHPRHVVWLQILTSVISLAATVVACCIAYSADKEDDDRRAYRDKFQSENKPQLDSPATARWN